MQQFWWRQRVQLEIRVSALNGSKEILVPLKRKIWIVTALQQNLHTAYRQRFINFLEEFVKSQDVPFVGPHWPIKCAEHAPRDTDVRVIDVAVDDIGDGAARVLPCPNHLGQTPKQVCRCVRVQRQRFVAVDPASSLNLGDDGLEAHTDGESKKRSSVDVRTSWRSRA